MLRKILEFSLGPIGTSAVGLVTVPVITWVFSPDDIGRLTMLQITVSLSILISTLGLDQAYVREYYEQKDKPALLKSTLQPGLLTLFVAILILYFLPWSPSFFLFGIESAFLTGLLILAVLISFFCRFFGLILRMQERGLAFSMSQLLPKLIFLLLLLSLVVFDAAPNFRNLMIANVVALTAVFVILSLKARHEWLGALQSAIDRKDQKRMIRYAIPLVGSGIAFWGVTSMDKIFLRTLSNFEELGIYSVAASFSAAGLIFQAIFSTIWAPLIYKWVYEGVDKKKVTYLNEYISLIVIFLWMIIALISWTMSYLLPVKYGEVYIIFLGIIGYPLLYVLSEVSGVGLGIQRKTNYLFLSSLLALLVGIISNLLLVPKYGANGAAMSTAISFYCFYLTKTFFSSLVWLNLFRFDISACLFVFVMLSVLINAGAISYSMYCFFCVCVFTLFAGLKRDLIKIMFWKTVEGRWA